MHLWQFRAVTSLVAQHLTLASLHIVSLVWGVLAEVLPWPCPLKLLENWLESRAGVQPFEGGFLLHYLDKLVYPNIPAGVLAAAGVVVCARNFVLYARQGWLTIRR
jgi:hypothetical protein